MLENPSSLGISARRPIVLNRGRAAFLAVFGYTLALVVVWATLSSLKYIQASEDNRAEQMTVVAGAILAALCVYTLVGIYRRPKFKIDRSMLRDLDA